jgi:hypothetical protein
LVAPVTPLSIFSKIVHILCINLHERYREQDTESKEGCLTCPVESMRCRNQFLEEKNYPLLACERDILIWWSFSTFEITLGLSHEYLFLLDLGFFNSEVLWVTIHN